jgi:hypothetical protein
MPISIYCQIDHLDIVSTNACFYSTKEYPEEYYIYNQDNAVEALKDDIIKVTKIKENFKLLVSNVENVASILSKNTRYVLYSRRYFNAISKTEKAVLLAHAIGHHVHLHTFKNGIREDEEIEADEFMGYALSLLGYNLDDIYRALKKLNLKDNDVASRMTTINSGFKRGEILVKNGDYAAFSEKEINEVVKNMPKFSLPPPAPSAEINLASYFKNCKTLSQVDDLILQALNNTGYNAKKYYYTEGGYALVTRIEQFNADGTSKQGDARWSAKPVRDENFSVMNYIKSLFVPEKGFFRVIVFVVSSNYYGNNTGKTCDKDCIRGWLNNGYTSLPTVIGNQPYNNSIQINALIYEFSVADGTKKFSFSKPSKLDGMTHLRMAKILDNIKK